MSCRTTAAKRPAMARGFTLIEAMIALAIIAILAGVGWSMYDEQMAKQRVTDGIILINKAQAAMEKCLLDKGSYSGCDLSGVTSPKGYYTLSSSTTTTTYTLTAAPTAETASKFDSAGVSDRLKSNLTLDHLGRKSGPWP
ncbi:MAG TPA: prepilin-type N-terminal cleavage/methylation domain-containing protein [Gammaproteobacteria bacterium]|nr:prepilin-type N-terminal cleavage/methylation domain-containing protein [Gammaproteobacteria bacterium]